MNLGGAANSMEKAVGDRFWSKVDKSGGPDACWEWKASRRPTGYGQIRLGGRTIKAHRFAWWLAHGPIPEGLCVLHRCDNPPCCNPAHLFPGTQLDNLHDMEAKGRKSRGERGFAAKLTDNQVGEIRAAYAAGGVSQRDLAKRFCVSHSTIGAIVRLQRRLRRRIVNR